MAGRKFFYEQSGKEVAKARVGQRLRVPEGTYKVVVKTGQPVKVEGVKVIVDQPVSLTLRRSATGWFLMPAPK